MSRGLRRRGGLAPTEAIDPAHDLREFLDRIAQPVALLTRGRTIRQANSAFASLFGPAPETLVGTALDDLIPDQLPPTTTSQDPGDDNPPPDPAIILSIRLPGEPSRPLAGHLVRWPTSGDPLFGLVVASPSPTPTTGSDSHLNHRIEMERVVCSISSVIATRVAERTVREAHEREIRIAREIHRELLVGRPAKPRSGAEVAVLSRPSMHVDGDLVDFFPDNDHLLDVLVVVVMGEVIPAALIAAATRLVFLRARSRLATVRHGSPPHPETILGFVHTEIAAHLGTLTSFVTLVFARLDMQARLLFVVNCGHPPVLLLKGETGEVISLASGNPALGIGQRPCFQGVTCPYVPGDLLVFLSDGVTEARRAGGQIFSLPRVIPEIRRRWKGPVHLMVDGLAAAVEGFLEGEPLQDDCTCVILRLSDLKHP